MTKARGRFRQGGAEVVYASSKTGERKGDPRYEFSDVAFYYEYAPQTSDRVSSQSVLDGHGLIVRSTHYLPNQVFLDFSQGKFADHRKLVTVRRRSASLISLHMNGSAPDGGPNWRLVYYDDLLASGGRIRWLLESHPKSYTDDQVVDFFNSLREI